MDSQVWKILRNIVLVVLGTAGAFVFTLYLLSLGSHDALTKLLKQVVQETTGATLEVEDVRLRYLSNFPFLTLQFERITLNNPDFPGIERQLLQANTLGVQVRPLSLFGEVPKIHSIVLSEGKMMIFRDANGKMNLLSGGEKKDLPKQEETESHLLSIDLIRLEDFSFQYLDSMRGKDLSVTFEDTRVNLNSENGQARADIIGTWQFDGLTFKMEKGGFLTDKQVEVDITADLMLNEDRILFRPSGLDIGGQPFEVEGVLELSNPAYLELELATRQIEYDHLLPLLTPDLQNSLEKFDLQGGLDGDFLLAGFLKPGVPAPVSFRASAQDATLKFSDISFDSLSFNTSFDSRCDTLTGPDPIDCLVFENVQGKLLEKLPFGATILLHDLKDPFAIVDANFDFPLSQLDGFLPDYMKLEQGQLTALIHHEGMLSAFEPDNPDTKSLVLTGDIGIRDGRLRNYSGDMVFSGLNTQIQLDDEGLFVEDFRIKVNGDPFQLSGRIDNFLPALISTDEKVEANMAVSTPSLDMDHFLGTGEEKTKETAKLKQAKSVSWDGMANVVDNILTRGEASLDVYAGELIYGRFSASKVSFNSRLLENCPGMTDRCLELNDLSASIYDFIPLRANLTILRPNDPQLDVTAELSVVAKDINQMLPTTDLKFREGKADISLRYQGAMNDFLDTEGFALLAEVDGALNVDNVVLDMGEGRYVLDNLHAALTFDEKNLRLDSLSGQVNNIPLFAGGIVSGLIPFVFLPERELEASLSVHSPYLDFGELPFAPAPKQNDTASVEEPELTTGVTMILDSLGQYLKVDLRVSADSLKYQNFRASEVAFISRFWNDCSSFGVNSPGCLVVDSFKAVLMNSIPLEMNIRVFELHDPLLELTASVDMPLTNLNHLFPSSQLVFHRGDFNLDFAYSGQPHNHFDNENLLNTAVIKGKASIQEASFEYVSKGYRLDSVQASVHFDESDFFIDTFDLRLNENDLVVQGMIEDLVPFLASPTSRLEADLSFYSPSFNIDNFKAPKTREHLQAETSFTPNNLKATVDSTLGRMQTFVFLQVDELKYRDFLSENVKGNLFMSADKVVLDSLDMEVAEGTFFLRGEIDDLRYDEPKIDIVTRLNDVNVKKVFEAFNNFGQEGITAENLHGNLTAEIDFQANANNNYDLLPESFRGEINIDIVEGALLNLPMFQDMNSFIFRGRQMENLQFAELKNHITLNGKHFHIDHFDVYSSAFTFSLEGLYCFHEEGHTNLLFTIPFSNLFRKHLTLEEIREQQESEKRGLSLFIRMRQKKNKLKIYPTFVPKKVERELEEMK